MKTEWSEAKKIGLYLFIFGLPFVEETARHCHEAYDGMLQPGIIDRTIEYWSQRTDDIIARTRQETLDAVEAGMPVERNDPGDFGSPDDKLIREQWWGFTVCRTAMLAHLKTLRAL